MKSFAYSFGSTLVCEEFFNICRRQAAQNKGNKLDVEDAYHGGSIGGNLLREFGREQVPVTTASRVAAAPKVSKVAFGIGAVEHTLTQDDLEHLGSARPDWPAIGPQALKQQGVARALMVKSGGLWANMESAWMSMLMVPNTVAIHKAQKQCAPVGNDRRLGFPEYSRQSCQFHAVFDPDDWRVGDVVLEPIGKGALPRMRWRRSSSLVGRHPC